MDQTLKNSLMRWKRIQKEPQKDPQAISLVEDEINRLIHGDPERGRGIPWSLRTDSWHADPAGGKGSALRQYKRGHSWLDEDANKRVIVRFAFDAWAQAMTEQGKPFVNADFPFFHLYVTPDDVTQIGGFDLEAVGRHNVHAHGRYKEENLYDPDCWYAPCIGYGYSPINPYAKAGLAPLLRTLATQDHLFPGVIAVGEMTCLIMGRYLSGHTTLVLRKANDWQVEIATDPPEPPTAPQDGPVLRGGIRHPALLESMEKTIPGLGTLTYDPRATFNNPREHETTDEWCKSRMATLIPTGGTAEPLTLIPLTSDKLDRVDARHP